MRRLALSDEILLSVQQPARYIGGEVNMCIKNPYHVDIRFAMRSEEHTSELQSQR